MSPLLSIVAALVLSGFVLGCEFCHHVVNCDRPLCRAAAYQLGLRAPPIMSFPNPRAVHRT